MEDQPTAPVPVEEVESITDSFEEVSPIEETPPQSLDEDQQTEPEEEKLPQETPQIEEPEKDDVSKELQDDEVDEDDAEEEEQEDEGPKDIREMLKLSEPKFIRFGIVFPGIVKEQKLMIENPSKHQLTLKVKVECYNEEYDDLEEYVYSIRKPPHFDYNDTYYVMMNEKDFITFLVAIKVPKIRERKALLGGITVSSDEFEGKFEIQLRADTVVPIIKCPKLLYVREIGLDIVLFNLKYLKKQEFRFPIKVTCPSNNKFSCEMDFIDDGDEESMFTFRVLPKAVTLQDSNGVSQSVVIDVRSLPAFDRLGRDGMKDARKVLMFKISNSSVIYAFPLLFKYHRK